MRPDRVVGAAFVVSALASIALMVWYVVGGGPRGEGVLLGVALGGLGIGIVIWASALMEAPEEIEERVPFEDSVPGGDEVHTGADAAAARAGTATVTRRTVLVRLLGAAAAALAGGIAIPALSLGPRPGQSLVRTAWARGSRVVDAQGAPVRAATIGPGQVLTVFPEGHAGSADSQTLIVKVEPDSLDLPAGRETWTPEGCVAYSKLCTHAGCPVGLYRAESHELLCPCHQSTFDVLTGAQPTFGPAARPLPQLPLAIDDDGYLVAQDDFSEPVGPSFWDMT